MAKFTDCIRPAPLVALALCLGLTACASLSIPKQPSNDYIATLLDNHDFDTAILAVDKWQASHPNDLDVPKQRKDITQAINQYETNALNTAKQLDTKGQWQAAREAYENALTTLPSSQPLQNAYSEFSVRRLQHISALKEAVDVAQAQHWLNINSDVKAMHAAAPDDREAQAWKQRSDAERDQLAQRLIRYGQTHEENKHYGTAALRYDLAYRLSPSEMTKPYHERAAKTFAQRNEKQKSRAKANQQRQQSKLSQLIDDFDRHLAQQEFQLAKQTLSAMEVIDQAAPEVQQRKARLEQQRSLALQDAIQEGKQFYTKGEFDRAIQAWQHALTLDPDNKELKENIQRAEKFRDNLQRLKQGS